MVAAHVSTAWPGWRCGLNEPPKTEGNCLGGETQSARGGRGSVRRRAGTGLCIETRTDRGRRDVVVIGASAGGIEALQRVLAGVPADLAAAVLVVVHLPPTGGSALAAIVDRAGPLPAALAEDGERLRRGRIYVARGGRHLTVSTGHAHLTMGPRENGHRPAADALFRTASLHYGPRVAAVVLSGTLTDGTAGAGSIRRRGGLVIVQDPADSLYGGMPRSAMEYVGADHVLPADEIGALLAKVCGQCDGNEPLGGRIKGMHGEVVEMPERERPIEEQALQPSEWPCPDCSGVLWEDIDDAGLLRFRCRVGHAWSVDDLFEHQAAQVETAMWVALRSLEDRAALSRRMADRAEESGRSAAAGRYRDSLRELHRSISVIRALLADPSAAGSESTGDV